MKIEKLHIMPELERNESNDGYTYPEKYVNKLYEHDTYYIYFRKNKIDTFPKIIFDTVIQSILEEKSEELSKVISESTLDHIDKLIQDKLNNSFININSSLENWTQKIDSKIDLKDLQLFREEINNGINNLTEAITSQISENSQQTNNSNEIHIQDLEEFKNIKKEFKNFIFNTQTKLNEFNNITDDKINNMNNDLKEYTDDKIVSELQIVKDNMTNIIKENIKDIISYSTSKKSGEISLSKLSALKELGFSVDDIIKLNSEGLL